MEPNQKLYYRDLLVKVFNNNRWSFRTDLTKHEQEEAKAILQNIYDKLRNPHNSLSPYSPDTHQPGSYLIYFSFVHEGIAEIYTDVERHNELGENKTAIILRSFKNPFTPQTYQEFFNHYLPPEYHRDHDDVPYDEHERETIEIMKSRYLHAHFQCMVDSDTDISSPKNFSNFFSIPNQFNDYVVYEIDEEMLLPLQKYLDHPISSSPLRLFADIPPAL